LSENYINILELIMKRLDIFDKLMSLPVLNIFEPFYKKNKEILLYLFFGGLAFLLNIILFYIFYADLLFNELVANALSWILCVLFQFFTNRIWVFDGKTDNNIAFFKQMFSFTAGRVFTLVIEEIILAIFITCLNLPSLPVKLAAQVIVIVLNYVISKLYVFKK
jgi:predicted membrane protein